MVQYISMTEQTPPKQTSYNQIEKHPLLDITLPYRKDSMLAKSYFYGFQVLVYLIGAHFALSYTVTNYINKGYFFKSDILIIIMNNLIWDFIVLFVALIAVLLQLYIGDLLMSIKMDKQAKKIMIIGYTSFFTIFFVSFGLFLINTMDFYFTDKIFIVVCSWILPVKATSYCLDCLQAPSKHNLWTKIKFIISPLIIYKDFVRDHNPSLKIHLNYLMIKSLTATMCLLINYLLVTEVIYPFIETNIHKTISFPELFFRLTPLLFFEHLCLYYLIMENIMLSMAQITQLTKRRFFQDWWNAETVSQYLDKWVLMINSFSDCYFPFTKRTKHAIHLIVIFIMLFSILDERINLKLILFAGANILIVFFLGENKKVQNNYVVHFLTICFQPFCLAAIMKYNIFN